MAIVYFFQWWSFLNVSHKQHLLFHLYLFSYFYNVYGTSNIFIINVFKSFSDASVMLAYYSKFPFWLLCFLQFCFTRFAVPFVDLFLICFSTFNFLFLFHLFLPILTLPYLDFSATYRSGPLFMTLFKMCLWVPTFYWYHRNCKSLFMGVLISSNLELPGKQ